jgi:hypothetical protein
MDQHRLANRSASAAVGTLVMVTTIRCPKCGTLSDEGVDFCPDCDTFLPWTDAEARVRPTAGLELAVSETRLHVVPGGEASVEVNVRNTGRNVDRVDLHVVGDAQGWTVVEPGTISLLPGAGTVARLTVRPPRDATVPAGQHILELQAHSLIDPAVDAEQRVSVDVAPFDDLRVRMTPPTSRGTTKAFHRVVVENAGNHPVTVSLHGRDRDGAGEVSVALEPAVIELDGGANGAATATVSPARPLDGAAARPRPFVIVAQVGRTETTLDGVMIQESEPQPVAPVVPAPPPPATPTVSVTPTPAPRRRRWWPRLLAILVLLGGLVGGAVAVIPDDIVDRLGLLADDADDGADGARRDAAEQGGAEAAPPPAEQDAAAVALPDLTIVAVQCALVPEAAEIRFAVQVANQGDAAVDGPVLVSAVSGERQGSTEVVVDGLSTGVFGVPVDASVLGTDLELTFAIDPGDAVEEADEDNNVGGFTITLPPAANQPVNLCG